MCGKNVCMVLPVDVDMLVTHVTIQTDLWPSYTMAGACIYDFSESD